MSPSELVPDWQQILRAYTLAAPFLLALIIGVVALWQAWQRSRARERELSDQLLAATREQAAGATEATRALSEANTYLRDLRDQGIASLHRGSP